MPKVSKQGCTKHEDHGPVVDRSEDMDGYTVNFTEFRESIDATPMMKELPGGRCQCPHWGYVFKGSMTFRYADRDEVYRAGEAFYAPPGHIPVENEPGSDVLQFSPADELEATAAVLRRGVQAMRSG
jgi:hypothetical protein